MWTAHMIARELGFKLNVVTRSFSAKFANGYSRCIGLADRKNRIFTISAESYKQTNFWVTFRHELFHLFAGDKTFMKDFLRGMAEATSGQSDVAYFLHDEIHRNDYLAPYRDEFDKYDLSTRERNLLLLEEMCAELLAGNNDGLKLDQSTFDALHAAAVKVFDEVSPKFEAKIKEKVLADRLETKGYKIAEQQDAVDSKRSDEVERPDRAFALSKEQFWDEQIDGLSDDSTFDAMYIKETPNILAEIGLGDLPMCMTKSHARDSLHAKGDGNMHWHGVPESVMMRLPDLLSTPAMVLNSQTKRGDILVVLNAVDNDGLPIVAAIHPNGRATVDGERGPANFILSVYGRSNFAPQPGVDGKNNLLYLALKDKNILYWNKKRTETLFHNAGLQLPRTMEKVPSDTILKQYRGYVKDRIPERMFSLSKYDDIEAKLDEIEQKNKALSDLVAKLEEAFPSEADYNFSTWLNAMHYLDNTSTTKLGFDVPMPFDDEVDVGYMHNGEWVSVATFENSKDGLKKFNQELAGLIQAEAEAEAVEDDIDDLPDEWLLEDDHFEDFSFLDIYDDSTQYHGEDDESMYYRNIMNERSLSDRTGFTDTDSKAFQKWFNDDSGMLTGKDGKPRIFLRGTQYAGSTKMRDSSGAKSRGLFFTLRQDIAEQYANGITVGADEHVTAMDRLKGTIWNKAEREWKPHNFKSWNNARKYIEETFTDDGGYNGIELVGIDGETGEIVPSSRATQFILRTNITTQNHRLSTPGLPLFTEDGFRELKSYPATKAGLTQLNKDLGDFVRELGMGMRGYSKFYLSAENTFVFDAQNADYGYLPDYRLPEKLKSGHDTGTQSINGLAERAFAAGYDCVIVTNVNDAGGLQTQYIVKSPTQVKSVYNRGTWSRREPDFMFSLAKEDYLMDYLDNVEMEYGGDFAQELFDAFETMDLSKRIAEVMSEIEASVGAAKSGFDPYSHLQNEYGTVEPGEKPARTVDLPKQTKDDNKVGQTPRTVMEAEATPESRIESIEQAVVDHKFSYKEGHNKIMVRRAEAAIRKNGWAESLTDWTRDVRDGKVNADLVAMGAVLLDNAGNSDMAGDRYVQLVVDYHDLLHAAGQATQAARILKNLTPGARLYGLRGYAKNMTERIRKGDPAHNIPVEKWMEVTGNLLADRLRMKLNVPKKHAKTVSQTILSDLNAFAKTAFPEQEKTPGRTEMDRINDLFDNYEKYKEAWDAAKETIKKEYADMPEALEVFNNFLETDLADTFIGQYFGHPEIRIDQALQQKFLSAKTDEERDAVTEEITKNIAQQIPATFMDKFTALRYLNMLGNFKTQIRNVTGNALNAGLTKGKNQVATLIELAVIKAGGKIERTKSFKKDPEVYRAALKDAEKMMDAILAGGKYEDGRRFDANIEKYRTIFKNKALEKYRKLTNEAMSRGDAVFSKIAYADALAGYLSAHGKTFETAGTELLDNARAYALKQAAEATFRDSNMFSDAIVAMRFRNPDTPAKKALNMIGEGILPFRKTPANILVRAVEYSPVGVITTMAETVYGKKTGTFSANKLIDSLAKNATGTMIFAVGALLSNLGLLKGKEPDEDKEKEFDALTGHQAYSIELPNGMSLTLDWLAPSSVPLFLGAQFAENAADAGLSFRDVLTAMGAITDPMLQMSMLQGLDDALANASTYGDDSALVRFTGNALWSFLTQGLTNTMLGQLERSLSNERSTTYRDKHKDVPDGIQYLIGKTLEKVPLPGADYGQIPYIDAWGRIETNARTDFGNVLNQFFVPSYVSWVEESKMEKELRRLYEANPDENASVLISRPKSYFNVDNKRKDLTAEEFIEYATTRGQTAYNVATDLTESEIYGTLSDKQKTEAVLKAYDFANQMAKAVTTGYTPDKWDEDAPEGSVNPDNWVKEAMTCATEYGVPVGEYAAIYAATKDLESYKNSKGETVDNSKSLKVAVAIYDMGLSDAETKSLLEAFGVNQTVRKYSEKTARAKLKAMKEKYE